MPLIAAHLDADEIDDLLDAVDGVVISGGQDLDPAVYDSPNTSSYKARAESDTFDLALTERAVERGIPVLGVCRGAQIVNVAFGGDLVQEVQIEGGTDHPTYKEMWPDLRGHRHDVDVVAGTRLAEIYRSGNLTVNSLHHQAIGRLGEGVVVTATAPDGVIEAVEHVNADVVAVQWHPEMLGAEDGDALFADLVARARRRVTMPS